MNQLVKFESRFGAMSELQKFTDAQLKAITTHVIGGLNTLQKRQTVVMPQIISLCKPSILADDVLVGVGPISNSVIGYIVVAQNNINWTDCDCSGLGKFTKI